MRGVRRFSPACAQRGAQPPGDLGESLVEVVITIIIISVAVTALIASLATAASSGASHRRVQTADVVVRDYAESMKSATATCTSGASYASAYTPPTDYSVSFTADDGKPGTCPEPTTIQVLTLTVTPPSGGQKTMQLAIRTP